MVFGFLHRNPVPKLRKKYDRVREKTNKLKNRNKKLQILRLLDQIEPTLISLEEQEQPKFERRRMIRYINNNIEQAQDLLKEKEYNPTPQLSR